MDIPKCLKSEPNRKRYIEILRKMTGEQRMRIGFELFGMALLSAKRFTLKPLVTHLFKLNEINDAFQAAYEKPQGFIKSVVVM